MRSLTGELLYIRALGYSLSICKTKKSIYSRRVGIRGKVFLGLNFLLQKIK